MFTSYIQQHKADLLALLADLCHIPAPSGKEAARAAFCLRFLQEAGAESAYIDEANNVIFPIGCEGSREITVFCAHTDTVFPDTEPMPYRETEDRIYCPGVGDDTASLAVLLYTAKYFLTHRITPKGGVIFLCNAGEEGLGNLYGTRAFFRAYEGRVKQFVSLDSNIGTINHTCVGSHRYRVEVRCEGGHSYQSFGKKSAIAALAEIVTAIYGLQVPVIEGARTTYNVGEITGGTSVNTIAQQASALCEYRSDSEAALSVMEKAFADIFAEANDRDTHVTVTRIGERPCAGAVDAARQAELTAICAKITEAACGMPTTCKSASTDCNIPLSLGIPAVCIGVYTGSGEHTREEYIEKSSLPVGFGIALSVATALCGV